MLEKAIIIDISHIKNEVQKLKIAKNKLNLNSIIYYSHKDNNLPQIAQIMREFDVCVKVENNYELTACLNDGFLLSEILFYPENKFATNDENIIYIDSFESAKNPQNKADSGLHIQNTKMLDKVKLELKSICVDIENPLLHDIQSLFKYAFRLYINIKNLSDFEKYEVLLKSAESHKDKILLLVHFSSDIFKMSEKVEHIESAPKNYIESRQKVDYTKSIYLQDGLLRLEIGHRIYKEKVYFPPLFEINDKLKLKRVCFKDCEAIFAIVQENMEHFSRFMEWPRNIKDSNDIRRFIYTCIESFNLEREYSYSIFHDEKIVGFFTIRNKIGDAEIGYWLDSKQQRQGIMGNVLKNISDFLLNGIGLYNIYVKCAIMNEKSNKIPQKLGYKLVGILENGEKIGDKIYDQNLYVLSRIL